MKKIFAIIFVAVMSTLVSCDDDLKFTEDDMNDYEYNFEFLWKEINEKYCFFDFKKDSIKDWDDVHKEYLPYVKQCKSEIEFFDIMGAMLNELKDGHVDLVSSFDISSYYFEENYPKDFDTDILNSDRYLGKNYRRSGGFKYKTLRDGNVGYMYFGDFMSSFTHSQIDFILNYFQDTKGIIIDVRNNSGGDAFGPKNIISHFIKEPHVLYYLTYKTGKGHSDFSSLVEDKVEPVKDGVIYDKPVYVLTNRGCFSATNIFAFSVKGLPRMTILGAKTGGGTGSPTLTEMPNGWLARYSGSILLDKNKQNTEFGVEPDIELHLDEELARTQGLDNIIETACDYIEGKIK